MVHPPRLGPPFPCTVLIPLLLDPIVPLLCDPERSYLHTYAREGALHTSSSNLALRGRQEYLTWSVANARGHADSPCGHTESVVGFLTDMEEKREVAKVQRELLDEVGHLMVRLQEEGLDLNTQSGWGGYDRPQGGLLPSPMYVV